MSHRFLIPAVLMGSVFIHAVRTSVSGPSRESRFLALGCTGGLAAMLIHSFADFNMYVPANAMVLAWIAGISSSLPVFALPESKVTTLWRSFPRGIVLVLGSFKILYAGGWLVFLHWFLSDFQAERLFCAFGICHSNGALDALQREHGGEIAAVPPAQLRDLLRRDPAGPYNWENLGESLQRAGSIAAARHCFSRALTLGPRIPSIQYRAALFHFSLRENRNALDLMSRAMQGYNVYQEMGFDVYEQRKIPLEDILRYGLLDQPSHQAYLRFLIAGKKTADPEAVWNSIFARGYADDKLANEYVAFLLQNKQPEAAAQAWASYVRSRDQSYPESNRIFNGSFELEPTGSRFDWTIEQTPGAKIDFDREVAHSGARSLRIQFDGTQNLTSIGIYQTVFLKPGPYRFQVYIRTKDISTDEGVAFHVASEQAPNRLSFTTEPMLGSAGNW